MQQLKDNNIEIPDKFQGRNGLFNYLEDNTEATNYFYKMFKETLAWHEFKLVLI